MTARRPLLVLAGLAVGLVVAELGVRLAAPQPESVPLLRGQLTRPGETRVFTPEYDVRVHVNADGFVDREWGDKRGPRVVLIGDSFVQAAQVTPGEGIGRRLEAELPGVEVLSMGVPGAGTATELGVLETWGLPARPDVVVLGFLVANDVLNNHPLLDTHPDKPFYRLANGGVVPAGPTGEAVPLPWLWSRSHAFRLVAGLWAAREAAQEKIAAGGGIPVDYQVYAPTPDPRWEEAWAITGGLLTRVAEACADAGVPLVIALFPDQVQATADGRARVVHDWPQMATWDPTAAQRRARALAEPIAPTIDLLPAFTAAPPAPPLYFPRDGHWTPAGHALAARALAPEVAARLR